MIKVEQSEASVHILWQNLIALNASLCSESLEQKQELQRTKELLKEKTEENEILLTKNKQLQVESSTKTKKIAQLSSKMVAMRQIVLSDQGDDDISPVSTVFPVIVKVESVKPDADSVTTDDNENVCTQCGKTLRSRCGLKSHMRFHAPAIPCPKCRELLPRPDYLQKHLRRIHGVGSQS